MTKSRGINKPKFKWRDEVEVLMLKQHYADTPSELLCQVFGCSLSSLYKKARKLGLAKSLEFIAAVAREKALDPNHPMRAHCFEKGTAPPNKGLKRPGWSAGEMARTQFKKGDRPFNEVPIGSYRINKSWKGGGGCLEVKLTELPGPYTLRWKPVHRLVWEQANGPVPEGRVVAFKPGRKSLELKDITLDALECITRAENARRNKKFGDMPIEIRQLHQLRGALSRQINKRAKEQEDQAT